VTLTFDANDRLVGLSGDFMPGASRDEEILGKGTETTLEQQQGTKPGSLQERIQRSVDEAKPVPVPVPEPLDPRP
jgi:outer membrane protein assembly factor BamE